MSFYSKFELLELLRDGTVKVFSARQIATGHKVSVHLMVTGDTPDNEAIVAELRSLPEPARSQILEIGNNDGTPYVVTTPWNRPESLTEWVVAANASKPSTYASDRFTRAGSWRIPTAEFGKKVADSTRPAGNDPGEFTRLFQSPRSSDPLISAPMPAMKAAAPPIPEEPQPKPDEPKQPDPEPPSPVANPEPSSDFERFFGQQVPPAAPPMGEFTRQFQVPRAEQPVTNPPQPLPTAKSEPGEFTRMFQTSAITVPSAPAPAIAEEQGPGEFTRMFHAPASGPDIKPEKPVPQHVDSEFTKFFDAPREKAGPTAHPAFQQPLRPSTPQNSANAAGEFTRMFGAPTVPAGAHPSSSGIPQPAVQTDSAVPPGPGEYTRMFAAPAQPVQPAARPVPPEQAPPPLQATPKAASAKLSYVPLFILLGVLLILAIALILFFALR